MEKTQTKKEKLALKEGQFLLNADYTSERTGNYKLRDKIKNKWQNYDGFVDGCGNCHHEFYFDLKNQTFIFSEEPKYLDELFVPLYKIMSPALFLYRFISTFFGTHICEDGYKSIWHYNLQHKETRKAIGFSEWKGAIGFWLPETSSSQLNKTFKTDLIELMNYICSNQCAHPYDGLVAGSIA